jgi:hypothetical protein
MVSEAEHTHPPKPEVKNVWSFTSTPPYNFMACYLVKHNGNFTFTLPCL